MNSCSNFLLQMSQANPPHLTDLTKGRFFKKIILSSLMRYVWIWEASIYLEISSNFTTSLWDDLLICNHITKTKTAHCLFQIDMGLPLRGLPGQWGASCEEEDSENKRSFLCKAGRTGYIHIDPTPHALHIEQSRWQWEMALASWGLMTGYSPSCQPWPIQADLNQLNMQNGFMFSGLDWEDLKERGGTLTLLWKLSNTTQTSCGVSNIFSGPENMASKLQQMALEADQGQVDSAGPTRNIEGNWISWLLSYERVVSFNF